MLTSLLVDSVSLLEVSVSLLEVSVILLEASVSLLDISLFYDTFTYNFTYLSFPSVCR